MRSIERPTERSYLSLIPRRNFRRALFLLLALLAVVALKKSGVGFFDSLFKSVGPTTAPPTASPPTTTRRARAPVPETTVHLRGKAPAP